jgi:hypothetical protein
LVAAILDELVLDLVELAGVVVSSCQLREEIKPISLITKESKTLKQKVGLLRVRTQVDAV